MFFQRGHSKALRYVDRGDISAYDYQVSSFTKDGNWHDLDLSAKIPIGTKLVVLVVWLQADSTTLTAAFRKNGNTQDYNVSALAPPFDDRLDCNTIVVEPDENRVIEYRFTSGNWIGINIFVKGYFVED